MRRVARPPSCDACKRGAAAKLADGYGRALKLTTAFRFFGCGANIEICLGRSCSTFGACQTFKSLIATSMQQNAPSKRGIDELHARPSPPDLMYALPLKADITRALWDVR